jgi:hypothetical protein
MKLFLSLLQLSSNGLELNVPNKTCGITGYAQDTNSLRAISVYSTLPLAYFVILSPQLFFVLTHIYLTQTYNCNNPNTSVYARRSY